MENELEKAMDEEEDEEEEELIEGSLVDMRGEEEEGESCRPTLSRNLYWQPTRPGQTLVQPCPNGATGLARWACSHMQVSLTFHYLFCY
jgi:hypothetical protein